MVKKKRDYLPSGRIEGCMTREDTHHELSKLWTK